MDIIKFLRDEVAIELNHKVKIKRDNKMLNEGLWDPDSLTIFINEMLIMQSAKEKGINSKEYAVIIFLHELGHVLDDELEEIDKHINTAKKLINEKEYKDEWFNEYSFHSYKAEENAWKIAEDFIAEDFLGNFTKVKTESLKQHKEILKLEKKLLKLNHKASI